MNKRIHFSILCLILGIGLFANIFADISSVYSVYDDAVNKSLGKQGAQYQEMVRQFEQLQTQTKHMQQVVTKLENLNSRDINGYINEINALTQQSNHLMEELGETAKYQDFGVNQKANYSNFYDDNTDKTMTILNNSSDTIQKDAADNSPESVSGVLDQARKDVNSDSYIKSMTALADINAEIVKELQFIRTQLTAIAQSQNAVAEKQIQEEAAAKQEFDLFIDTSAVHQDIAPHPLENPTFH